LAKLAILDAQSVGQLLQDKISVFDKGGDIFYQQLSAFHKSVRGSSPDGALYWMARMLVGGCDPKTIASFLANEHPQTIAIILVHLESELAGQVIQFLPEKLRGEVLLRIATLSKVDPEIVKEISDALESELQSVGGALGKKMGGPEKAAEILSHAGRDLEDEVLGEIEDENPTLAEEIRKYLFTFEDFLNVDDFGIQTLLREISTDDLKLALKGASPEVREKFFRNMSKRAADVLKEELEMMGPVRISEVEKAQQNIIRIAKKLEQEGKIMLSKGEEEFV
jgi:flagellar motor switch protein FliG